MSEVFHLRNKMLFPDQLNSETYAGGGWVFFLELA